MRALAGSADIGNSRDTGELRQLEAAEREYIRALYLEHYPALQRYARELGFHGDAVEDWLHETFLAAIRRIEALQRCEHPRAYLIQILRNVIGNGLRSMKYAARIAEKLRSEEAGQEGYRDEPDPSILYQGLVSDEELRLLLAFYLEGRSQKELAGELGIDVGACNMRLQRAKAHLKAAMKRDGLL